MRVFRLTALVLGLWLVVLGVAGCARTPSPTRAFAYADGDFSATVRGTITRLVPDGYTGDPALTGESMTGVSRAFEATVSVVAAADGRRMTVTYASPPALCGVTVIRTTAPDAEKPATVRLTRDDGLAFDLSVVDPAVAEALLLPVGLLLPDGDITEVSPQQDGRYTVTRRGADGTETQFTFADGEMLPRAVTRQSADRRAEAEIGR